MAGNHTGEIELTGKDIAGIAVHIASRVSTTAGPNEVVVSSTVKKSRGWFRLEFHRSRPTNLEGDT